MKRDGGAKGIDEITRRRRIVQILDDDGQVAHCERERRGHEEQHQRQEECERQRAPIPDDLGQLFSALREYASHPCSYLQAATLPSCRAFSTTPMNTSSMEKRPSRICMTRMPFDCSFSLVDFSPARRIFIGNDMQPFAKQRDAPGFRVVLEQIRRLLRLVNDHLQQVTGLPALDVGRTPFGDQFARGHQAEAIALLRFLEVVGGHQNGGAGVGQPIDHRPEGAAGQRIHSGGRFVKEKDARLMQDCRAEGHTLLPPARQTSRDLVLLALQPRKRQHPLYFLVAFALGYAVNAGEEIQVFLDRKVVVQGELLRHVADPLAYGSRPQLPLAR